jgi:hypothetical protein
VAAQNGDRALKQRPIRELVKHLAEETATLLRQEVALAKAEMFEKVEAVRREATVRANAARGDLNAAKDELATNGKNAGIGAGFFAAAAAFALIALGMLALLLVRALDAVMPNALALALALVLLLYAAVAAILVAAGRTRLRGAGSIVPVRSLGRLLHDVTNRTSNGSGLEAAWPPVPEQTIETLKEDVEWARHPTRSEPR